jgi:hypothetical protein
MLRRSSKTLRLEDQVLCEVWQNLASTEELNRANNCYSYAVGSLPAIIDIRTRSHAEATPQPGDRSGIPKNILLLLQYRSLGFWIRMAERDGLKRLTIGPHAPLPEVASTERLVALTYNLKHHDYHWLRREQNGLWTHKPDSGRAPTWYDAELQLISDPRKAALWDYNSACAFFTAPLEGIDVRMTKPWLGFFSSIEDALMGNVEAMRPGLGKLADLVRPSFAVFSDYLADLSHNGAEGELQKFAKHLREGSRLPMADGLLPFNPSQFGHVPLNLAWQSVTR